MTLGEIRDLLVSVDPDIRHHFSAEETVDYTYWENTRRLPLIADDRHEEAWAFTVHRFTRDEFDPIAGRLFTALDTEPNVTVRYTGPVYEPDSGYLHHIYDCEGY